MAETKPLRFAVGDRVQCKTAQGEDGWTWGQVLQLWYREKNWPAGRVAPYQVKLDDGRKIFAPLDEDRVIRKPEGVLKDGKIPVTIFTGFLGAGKTTLLNYILRAEHGRRYAVIENEVGQVGIDNELLASDYEQKTAESITLLDNGCLCCTVRDDLVRAIKDIIDAAAKKAKADPGAKALDGILIETTGIADPGPICKTFYGDAFCSHHCTIDGVLTLVDAVHFESQLARERTEGAVNESAQQVAFADKVLLNKVDLCSAEALAAVVAAIRSVNAFVPITKCSLAKSPDAVPLETLLSINAFDLTKMLQGGDIDLSKCGEANDDAEEGHGGSGHGGGHESDDASGHGGGHGGGSGHGNGHGHGHVQGFRHDTDIGSFVCEFEGAPLDAYKFKDFLEELLENSQDLYRLKGFLAINNLHRGLRRQVVQGVHDAIDMQDGGPWPVGKPIKSQLVLIGRRLDRKTWTEKFQTLVDDGNIMLV